MSSPWKTILCAYYPPVNSDVKKKSDVQWIFLINPLVQGKIHTGMSQKLENPWFHRSPITSQDRPWRRLVAQKLIYPLLFEG